MPEKLWAAARQTGDYVLWGTGLGVIAGAISGHSAYDFGAIASGIGVGVYGLARGVHRLAEAYVKYQEAQAIRLMCKSEYVKRLQQFVCYNADGCLDRKTEPDEA